MKHLNFLLQEQIEYGIEPALIKYDVLIKNHLGNLWIEKDKGKDSTILFSYRIGKGCFY